MTAISDFVKRRVSEVADWIRLNTAEYRHLKIIAEPRAESLRAAIRGRAACLYKGKLYNEFLQSAIVQVAEQRCGGTLTGDIICLVEVVCTKPKATKRLRPGGDVDNLAKGVLDAMTQAGVYRDDDEIINLTIQKRWADIGEPAGVSVWVGQL